MIVLQPAIFIAVYSREMMELNDAVFPFIQVKHENDVQSSATNICSGRSHNDWNYEPTRSEHKVYGLP